MAFDPLEPSHRAALMRAARPRRLPLAPLAAPARRHLPLAGEARPTDRARRPVYAVWEITLACDLACRHCGSRAGRARPDELSTAECLDLVGQLAALGVREVTLIGGEAYLTQEGLAAELPSAQQRSCPRRDRIDTACSSAASQPCSDHFSGLLVEQ
jgi:radical SAM superfamily enzyme YgiQ (UPF0313 family)